MTQPVFGYSPAFRWGLIEAWRPYSYIRFAYGIPRHFAGASLKPGFSCGAVFESDLYSPAFRWGLIEATPKDWKEATAREYSPAFRWGLIEAAFSGP